jgi:lysophospholipase L1-like esterase
MLVKTLIILSFICITIIFAIIWANYQAQKIPSNSPSRILTKRAPLSNKKVVVCIGDSITHGRVSYNYVDILSEILDPEGYFLINAGINGEHAYHTFQRLDDIIKCNPSFITILIGLNDANATLSEKNRRRAVKKKNLPILPTDAFFHEYLIKICSKLKSETEAKIAILSIPPIGEELHHKAYKTTSHYSQMIKEIASMQEVTYIPIHEKIAKILESKDNQPLVSYGKNWQFIMYKGILFHFLLNKSFDEISKSNGFLILTDLLHLNSKGAKIIATSIKTFIDEDK